MPDHSVRIVAVACAIALAAAGPALAQEEKYELSYWDVMFSSVGSAIQFGLLFAASIAGMTLVIEYFINLRREKLIPPEVVEQLEGLIKDQEYAEAMDLCRAEPALVTSVMAAAIPKMEEGRDAMIAAAREMADEESLKLQLKVSWLSLVTAISPMLGLLGTVTGMIQAFGEIAGSPTPPRPAQLANGISTALLTTAFGLMIAIPCMLFYFYFRTKVTRIAMENSALCVDLVKRIRTGRRAEASRAP